MLYFRSFISKGLIAISALSLTNYFYWYVQIKLCSRDPSPPPFSYVKGGGGIFADMAVHDLDMTRFLAGTDPIDILAVGSCHIDKSIEELPGSEKFDTASCIVRYPGGVTAMVDVCRQSSFGYDQRAEVLGTKGMIQTDNVYPNTAKIYKNGKNLSNQRQQCQVFFPFFFF